MPNLRYLLFLVTLVIVAWNFPSATALPINDTDAYNSSVFGKVHSVEKQASTEEEYREGRKARANEVLLWIKENQSIIENLSGPVKEYCDQVNIVRDFLKMYPKHDLVNDSELLRIHEDTVAVCERILDLCGMCPTIVQPVEPQMSILHQILAPIQIFLAVALIIVWFLDIIECFETKPIFQILTLRKMLFRMILWVMCLPFVAVMLTNLLELIACIFVVNVSYWTIQRIAINLGVERSQEQLLWDFDQILQRMKATQRNVVNLLAGGVTRDWLLDSERDADIELESMRMLKSTYESSSARVFIFKLKYQFDKIAAKMEEIVDVSERILYLCRPAVAA